MSVVPPEISSPIADFINKNKWVIIITVIAVGIAYASVIFLGKDNPIEAEVEKIIEAETGVRIDLTP